MKWVLDFSDVGIAMRAAGLEGEFMKELKLKKYEQLLREASNALWAELSASGDAEIKADPALRQHKRLAERIDKALERTADRERAAT